VQVCQHEPFTAIGRADQAACAKFVWKDIEFVQWQLVIAVAPALIGKWRMILLWKRQMVPGEWVPKQRFDSSNADHRWLALFDNLDQRIFQDQRGILRLDGRRRDDASDNAKDGRNELESKVYGRSVHDRWFSIVGATRHFLTIRVE
jgi:hypothetical protein